MVMRTEDSKGLGKLFESRLFARHLVFAAYTATMMMLGSCASTDEANAGAVLRPGESIELRGVTVINESRATSTEDPLMTVVLTDSHLTFTTPIGLASSVKPPPGKNCSNEGRNTTCDVTSGDTVAIGALRTVIDPQSALRATPSTYGPFLLVPYGYRVPSEVAETRSGAGDLRRLTMDERTIQSSNLYTKPGYLPTGFRLSQLQGFGSRGADFRVVLTYTDGNASFSVTRERLSGAQVEVIVPGANDVAVAEQGEVNGDPAVFQSVPLEFSIPGPSAIIWTARGNVLTILEGEKISLDELKRVAASLG